MTLQELFSIHSYHGYILQILIAELLFISCYKRRNHFIIRASFAFIFYIVLSIVLTNVLAKFIIGLSSITIFLISFFCFYFCFDNKIKDLLFWCVGAQLIQNLSHNVENLIYLPLSQYFNSIGQFFLSVGVMAIVYTASYFIIIKNTDISKGVSISSGGVFPIAIASALFCYLVQFLLQVYEIDTLWVTRLPLVFSDIIALILEFGILGYKNKLDENVYLEKFINQSDKYYQVVKDNIDILNMKAHDLKHFINDFRENKSIDDDELKELQKTVEEYEASPKTGNKALDLVLNEKSYICKNKNIPFYIMVKEDLIKFIKVGDITSLFGNLLSNAIEYEEKVEEISKRFILLKISQTGHIVSIHLENYCNTKIDFKNGLPVSTKGDDRYHGFGLKSVSYIVKKYDGTFKFSLQNDIYSVDIIFPMPKD